MNKNAIKKYAIWARKELIERVSQRALLYGISSDATADSDAAFVNGRTLTKTEQKQRKALIEEIRAKGYEQVMEEAAYTWFNRFAALRFMEVNGYLPSHIRVFTDGNGNFKPQILAEAIHLQLDGLNMDKVYEFERQNRKEALFKYLLIVQCNALNSVLPGMFQKIEDYTELLLPDYLLREGSVIEQMVKMIPEEDWTDQVQIIGWLYQYYNTEPKDKVFADLKKNIKISKENIPAATQLFTPDWIVHYMVENSLGRLWLEGHPNSRSTLLPTKEEQAAYAAGERTQGDTKWHYYLEEAEQEPEVEAQLAKIRQEYAALKPEEILCIDPCMGSGHILCVLFDTLVKIYEDYGYTAREAAVSIVEKNLWGLDIDDRAAQLAYFAVMMKARQYDRRFFTRKLQPHVYAIAESNHVSAYAVNEFCSNDKKLAAAMQTIIKELHDAKEYGSILTTTQQDWSMLYARFAEIRDSNSVYKELILALEPLVQTAHALAQKYHVVVTNPPYRGIGDVEVLLRNYVKRSYSASYLDMSTVFMEKCSEMNVSNGFFAMINIPVWMSLAGYSNLRSKLLKQNYIVNMLHLGRGMFGSDYGTTSFVVSNVSMPSYRGLYLRFFEKQGSVESEEIKHSRFFHNTKKYFVQQRLYTSLPNCLIAYWASDSFVNAFASGKNINSFATVFEGLKTRDKDRFLRFWFEVDSNKWKPYAKGGAFRRWYGNNDYVVNWGNNGEEIRKFKKSSGSNFKYYFKPAITYTAMTMSKFTGRYIENQIFGGGGGGITNSSKIWYLLGFVNSSPYDYIITSMKSTVNFEVGQIGKIPVLFDKFDSEQRVVKLVKNCVKFSRNDWDSFEISWNFISHPMVIDAASVDNAWQLWQSTCKERFQSLKLNEELLNRIFINIYGLQDELTPNVADKEVTVYRFFDTKNDIPESMHGSDYALTKQDAIKSLLSYAVGCMFGRYSLDEEGLVYAGGRWDDSRYKSFPADKDAIIPVCDNEYFQDDIVALFVKFIKTVYGEDTLEENLRFIANALEGRGTSREVIRNYFLNDFYKDHLKTYKKRPIYWLFDSGKKNGFKCLIYMHRYQPDTIARIRTDYVHELQSRYRTAIADLERRTNNASTSERVKLTKRLQKLQGQSEEIRVFEEKIHHLADQFIPIDLDDGVKVNYAKFQDVLAKIK